MSLVTVSDTQLVVPWRQRGTVVVSFDDSYVWSFRTPQDARRGRRGWEVSWPEALRPRLAGTTRVRIERDGTTLHDAPVTFGGDPQPLQLRDKHGHRLAVDKMGHLTRVFSETEPGVRRQVAEAAAALLADLRSQGYEAHLSYGCLLGAVRDGHMVGHDSDADLAYLSPWTTPADVILESYVMERALRRLGRKVIRMSGADLKVLHPLDDGRVVHIDIFGAFHVGETFYLLGGRSGRLPREAIEPARPVVLEGVEMPGPADPEAVLSFLYGAGWRVPDPAFQNEDPPEGLERLDGWLRGVRNDMAEWNELYRHRRAELPTGPSTFARWADGELGADEEVAVLGCGNGRDALWFAQQGRSVHAYDSAGAALRQTRRRMVRAGTPPAHVAALALNDRRAVLVAGAELSRTPEPVSLYARGLVGCLDDEALGHLWLVASMALRRGGRLFLEFAATGTDAPTEPAGLHRRVDPARVVSGIRARGGTVDHLEEGPGLDFFDRPDPAVARVVAHWNQQESA